MSSDMTWHTTVHRPTFTLPITSHSFIYGLTGLRAIHSIMSMGSCNWRSLRRSIATNTTTPLKPHTLCLIVSFPTQRDTPSPLPRADTILPQPSSTRIGRPSLFLISHITLSFLHLLHIHSIPPASASTTPAAPDSPRLPKITTHPGLLVNPLSPLPPSLTPILVRS